MRIRQWFVSHVPELSKFSAVGAVGVVVDAGVFNILLAMTSGTHVVSAKVAATAVAIVFAWVSHRYWTFAGRRVHRARRELTLFVAVNIAAMTIQAGVVWVSYYGLEYTSTLASNVAAYGIGLPLSTIARYIGYRMFVFTGVLSPLPDRDVDAS